VKLESGLQAIVRDGSEGLEQALDYVYGSALVQQRCIFHKLRNVSDKCIGLDREGKKQFLEQAAWIYQAMSALEAQARLVTFGERWRATQPQAVATFEREFEQTIRYYALPTGCATRLLKRSSPDRGSEATGNRKRCTGEGTETADMPTKPHVSVRQRHGASWEEPSFRDKRVLMPTN
jgi:hypothetical protein